LRILITNDDGINAPGLEVLHAIASEIAGPDGEVWTVAPAFEQSGVGHCISYTHPTMIAELGQRRFAAEGAPADCVLAGVHHVLKDNPPDLVLSGVNRGNNAGENVVYSGTVGGAMEGALQGIRSIALSQYIGPENRSPELMFNAAAVHGAAVVRALLDKGNWTQGGGYGVFYNVNFPPVTADRVLGTRVVTQGCRPGPALHTVEPQVAPSGRMFLWVRGGKQSVETGEGTDVSANMAGYISVTPLTCDLTAHAMIAELKERLDS